MKATNIKITILLFLVMACSPDHKPANKDLKDIQVLDSEATLAKVAQSKIDISEKELLTVSSNKSVEEEQALLEQVKKIQIQAENELIEAQSLQQLSAEQALLKAAKSRRDVLEMRNK